MKRFAIAGCLTALLMSVSPAGAQTVYMCGMGTIRSMQTVVDAGVKQAPPGIAERRMMRFNGALQPRPLSSQKHGSYLVAIQLDDVVYTGRSSHVSAGMADPGRFAINREVPTCIDEGELVFGRSDGTSARTTIVRTTRIEN
jgi:hypothetical protein